MAYSSSGHSSSCDLELIGLSTYRTIEAIVESSFDPCIVGQGRDADHLDHCGIAVTGIQRVKNCTLYMAYQYFKDDLAEKTYHGTIVESITDLPERLGQFNTPERNVKMNEIYLFHSTCAPYNIIREGFNTDTTDPNAMFGRGIYFAEKVTKADQYTDDREYRNPHGTELTLLLCRVLMGNAYMCNKLDAKRFKKPPCMKCKQESCQNGWENRYDSVLGCGDNMLLREFVVYDSRQCFPEFLIKYEYERNGD